MEGKNSLINLEQLVFGIVRTVPECVVYCTLLYYCTILLYYTVLYCTILCLVGFHYRYDPIAWSAGPASKDSSVVLESFVVHSYSYIPIFFRPRATASSGNAFVGKYFRHFDRRAHGFIITVHERVPVSVDAALVLEQLLGYDRMEVAACGCDKE